MDSEHWFILSINPEPWATGPLGINAKLRRPYMGRNQQLDAYKEAVREELNLKYPNTDQILEPIEIMFLFWRERARYTSPTGKLVTKNEVDTTNMQKATEDALQGLLFPNDKNVRDVHSILVDQGPHVRGKIAIRLRPWPGFDSSVIPQDVFAQLSGDPMLDEADNPMRPYTPGYELDF